MKCSTCFNNINKYKKCNICQEKFCSEECISVHNRLYHKFLLNQIDSQSINNYSLSNYRPKTTNIESTFLVKGILNFNYIIYDPIFSIENCTLIYSDGVPKAIGSGSFGKVYLAFNNKNKKTYAIKHMEKDNLLKYLSCLDPIYAEIEIQSRINHPNIIKLLYVKETQTTFDLVMDYAKNGTLFEYVVKHKGLQEETAFTFFIQIVNAIKFLHDNDIIHRDIKPENILLFENNVVKLCDFGWSIRCIDKLPGGSFSGTVEYIEIDMWMLGIFLYELMHGFSPFRPQKKKFEDKEVIDNIMNHKIIFYVPISEECKDLIMSLLEIDFSKRYTIDDVYNSKFVKNFERKGFNINSLSIKCTKNKKKNNTINYKLSQIKGNNKLKVSKSLLMNRYNDDDDDEVNENKQEKINNIKNNVNDNEKNYRFFNSKGMESDNLLISRLEKGNLFSDNKNDDKNTMNIDDSFEDDDEPNAPRNNKKNKNKKRRNRTFYESIVIVGQNQNKNYLSPIRKLEETPKNDKSNSPKNNDIYKKSCLNLNIIINNNNSYTNLLNYRERENSKLNNENIFVGNRTEKRVKKEITSFIFNNNELIKKRMENKIIPNKKSLIKINPSLSLPFSKKVNNYNSLLTECFSPDKKVIYPEENNNNNYNKKFHLSLNIREKLSGVRYNLKNYPFDHLSNNSTLDISKPILNSTNHDNVINKENESKEEDKIVIKEKEPNDNMRRKNKHQIPQDNHIKNIINKNDNPNENYKNNMNFINNFNNFEINGINNFKDEIINVNNSLSLKKEIKLQKENTDIMLIDPLKKNFKTDLRINKRKNIIPIDIMNTSEEPNKNINIKIENENENNNHILSYNLEPISIPNNKDIYQNTDNNSWLIKQNLESSSINDKLRKTRLINTDLREKKSRSFIKKIDEFKFDQNKQKTGIKLVDFNKANDNIEFVGKINDRENSIKKEKNKITKINKIVEIKNTKTQKEESNGIKIYKNGENREIKIDESKKINNFGNTNEIKINENKNINEVNKKIVIEDYKEIEISKDKEAVDKKSKENDNLKNDNINEIAQYKEYNEKIDELNNEINKKNDIKVFNKELELQKKKDKKKNDETQINKIKNGQNEIEKNKNLENKEIHLSEILEKQDNIGIKEDKDNENHIKNNNNRIETLNDKETELTEKIQNDNNLIIKEEGKEKDSKIILKEEEENNKDKEVINNSKLVLINIEKEIENNEIYENKIEKQENDKKNKQPIIIDKKAKPIKNKEIKIGEKKVRVKKINPINKMIEINKEKTGLRQSKENDEKNDTFKKMIKRNVITKKIEIKNGRNERLKDNETKFKTKVITKKINLREKSYSQIKKESLQQFEISQNQNMKVNPEKKLENQSSKIITSRQIQNKDYSSNLESFFKPYNRNNILKDKKMDFSFKDYNSLNFSQSLVFFKEEKIKTFSAMSPLNSNKIIKSKSPNIIKLYYDENQSNSQQFIVLNGDNDHDDDIKQIKLKNNYTGNNSFNIKYKNNIDKIAKNLNQNLKKENTNKNENKNFNEILTDKNYIENKNGVYKRFESDKEREAIISLKKKNIEKIRCIKIEDDEKKNKNNLNEKPNNNYEYYFNNGETKYGNSGLF